MKTFPTRGALGQEARWLGFGTGLVIGENAFGVEIHRDAMVIPFTQGMTTEPMPSPQGFRTSRLPDFRTVAF
jgi:hypothetical protein